MGPAQLDARRSSCLFGFNSSFTSKRRKNSCDDRPPPKNNLTFTYGRVPTPVAKLRFHRHACTTHGRSSVGGKRLVRAKSRGVTALHRSRPATSPSAGALSPTFAPLCLVGSLSLLFLPGILPRHHAPIPVVWESHVTSAGRQCTLSSVCSQPLRATTHLMHTGPAPQKREGSSCQPQAVALRTKLGDCWFHQDRCVENVG